jgi:hypothetical protein
MPIVAVSVGGVPPVAALTVGTAKYPEPDDVILIAVTAEVETVIVPVAFPVENVSA